MKTKTAILTLLIAGLLISWRANPSGWLSEKRTGYSLLYQTPDKQEKEVYAAMFDKGIKTVEHFFDEPYKNAFDIYIHPDRASLDLQWQGDWKDSTFKSECWMVASGVGNKLDILSPGVWEKQACEHHFAEEEKSQKLICHELFHVFHGQLNPSHDFSEVENIDWFVEGFATYASGQCDAFRLMEVQSAIQKNSLPASLDNFWKGKIKYGLSGSVVMYIDKKYGRGKLRELLIDTNKNKLLSKLGTNEEDLLTEWKKFMTDMVIH